MSNPAAQACLSFDGRPSTIYVRAQTSKVTAVGNLLAAQASPQYPGQVQVSSPRPPLRPSSTSPPRPASCSSAWARSRCWPAPSGWPTSWSSPSSNAGRRSGCAAPWAGQGQIRIQFRSEASLLALLGGAAGTGAVATAIYAHAKGWPVVIPRQARAGGLAAAVIIGAAAGLLAASGQTHAPASVSFPAPTFWQLASYLVDDRREPAGMQPDPAVADLESFLAERGEPLLRTAVLLAGSKEAGEDLLQAALERLLKHWRSIHGSPEGYLRRTLYNLAADGWRRESAWRRQLRLLRHGTDTVVADPAVTVDLRDALVRLLMQLPPRQRAVIVARYWEELSEAETAEALGCSAGTVKSQTWRAVRRLRELIEAGSGPRSEQAGKKTS
jgi:RNA polymerase sigma-70 factor (sigma-E family)